MVTYLAKWIQNLSEKMAPLRELTKQEVPWIWCPEIDAAFSQLKELLINAPVQYLSVMIHQGRPRSQLTVP